MKSKVILDPEITRAKLLKGVDTVYEAVSTTLGPRGQNVAIAQSTPYGDIWNRTTLHDGVSVAKAIDLSDEDENMGAQILIEAAKRTVDQVGDGTTLTIVLGRSIFKEALRVISTGESPMALREGLEAGRTKLIESLEAAAVPIESLEDEIRIATISAQDAELGELIANTLHTVGVDGVVTIEESKSSQTTVKYLTGMQFEQGWLHPLFITSPGTMEAILENPYILVTDHNITSLNEIGDLLVEISKEERSLVIISPDINGEAASLLMKNKLEGKLLSLAVRAPSFGSIQKAMLQDIALVTGARFVTEDAGLRLKDVEIEHLGSAEHVTATAKETLVVGGKGEQSQIDVRVAEIKKQLEDETQEFESLKLRERLGKLTNGIAVINVGGYTEIEMKERKERVDDAVNATRAAMRKGIVAGGELALLVARNELSTDLAGKILFRALEQPFRKLVSNAGFDAGEKLAKLELCKEGFGFDVTDGKFKDMIEAGIIDPVLVPIKALENSVSVAIELMRTAVLINPTKEDAKDKLR